jgi:hypothetical protein
VEAVVEFGGVSILTISHAVRDNRVGVLAFSGHPSEDFDPDGQNAHFGVSFMTEPLPVAMVQ